MANEIWTSYASGFTLYAVIRLQTDDTVNIAGTNNFEAWQDGNIGTYDVPLTDQGGDYYSVDFPTTIDSIDIETYRTTIYVQVGASPALVDFPISQVEVFWQDGEEIDTGTLSLSANDVFEVVDETDRDTLKFNQGGL